MNRKIYGQSFDHALLRYSSSGLLEADLGLEAVVSKPNHLGEVSTILVHSSGGTILVHASNALVWVTVP